MIPLDITLMAGGMPFAGDTLAQKSLGGSETAALCVARELGALGHRVTVFSNGKPGNYGSVIYRPLGDWSQYAQTIPHDLAIVQRIPEAFQQRLASRLNLLWCHDLALGRAVAPFRGILWNVDKVMVVSQFMAQQYREVYGLGDELWVTRNGIDLKTVEDARQTVTTPRNRKTLVYSARPERGLDVLLSTIFPQLLAKDPELRLHLCSYDHSTPQMQPFYRQIDAIVTGYGEKVKFLGHLTKAHLYAEYLTSGVYVYPTPSPTQAMFSEVSCISAMEAQACGLPIVTTARGALPETIAPDAGRLIDGDPMSAEYHNAFIEAVLRYINDDGAFEKASQAGHARAQSLDWAAVAKEWETKIGEWLEENRGSPHTVAMHFIRRSDIVAAKAVIKDLTDPLGHSIKTHLSDAWAFVEQPDGFRQQYESIGKTHTDVFAASPTEPRFQILEQWFRARPELHRILDFGCAHGSYAVNMANHIGREWVGVDIDRHSIDWAERNRRTRATTPASMKFLVGDEHVDLSGEQPFDCLLAMELLEHVPDAGVAIDAMERWIRPGGMIFISVPYGPWEYLSFDTYPHRAHIWEYDFHDLREMFGAKKNMHVDTMPYALEERTGEPLGWHLITWEVDGTKSGQIDLARKLMLQRPRQSVSALIVVGPGAEETLLWCLNSLKDVADEYVIADTGMSDEAWRIVRKFRARVVPAHDPLAHGFESPRNDGLAECRCDWVLWIDSDEKLVEPEKIHKYLRANCFNGYSIRQHHFACDTTFKPDLPIRLFRRAPYRGKSLRFFGMIHEHPELGLNEGPGMSIVLSDVHIAHVGYLIESGRRKRFSRNYPLLQRDIATYPDRLLQKHFMCRDNMLLATYELQQNGGLVTDTVRARCLETIDLWRKYFRGKAGYMNADTISYYSDANRILQQGFEFKFEFAAGKDGTPPNGSGPTTYRFATMEDLQTEMAWRSQDAAGAVANASW